MSLGRCFLLVLVWISINESTASAICQTQKSSEILVKATEVLQSVEGANRWFATYQIGKLPVGGRVNVVFKMVNQSDEPITFASVAKQCACSQFKSAGFTIPANSDLECSFKLKIPRRRNDSKMKAGLTLFDETKAPLISLVFHLELEGLLAFRDSFGIVNFGTEQEIKTLEIPFVITSPLDLNSISVESSESLRGLDFRLAPLGRGAACLRVAIARSVLAGGSVSGEVSVQDKTSGLKSTHQLTIKREDELEVSPQILRFRRKGDKLVAKSIVRLPPSIINEQTVAEGNVKRQFSVSCKIADQKVTSEVRQLSDGIYRVFLSVPLDLPEKLKKDSSNSTLHKIVWRTRYGNFESGLERNFLFE